jgi:hypothetical protein
MVVLSINLSPPENSREYPVIFSLFRFLHDYSEKTSQQGETKCLPLHNILASPLYELTTLFEDPGFLIFILKKQKNIGVDLIAV